MFYERLTALCARNKTSVSGVLTALGLSKSKGTAWKEGSIPNGEILTRLADYFGVSIDYLMGRTENPTPPEVRAADGATGLPPEALRELENYTAYLQTKYKK